MARETEVVHRPQHHDLLAIHRDDRVLGRFDFAIEEVIARLAGDSSSRVLSAFLEDVQSRSSRFGLQGRSAPVHSSLEEFLDLSVSGWAQC